MAEGTEFSRVVLTLENVCVPPGKIEETPSSRDGIDGETEISLRNLGCELIQTAGILLKLPQVAMATGQVLFQRFFYSKSFVKHNYEHIAMACINLAAKIEEEPRRLRDILSVFYHIKQMRDRVKMTVSPLILDQKYVELKNHTIKAERRILKELGFCVHVKHPHKLIVMYLKVLNCHDNVNIVQTSWNFMNDCLRTNVFVRFNPETIACACIYLAARQLSLPLPNNPHWFMALRISEEDVRTVCLELLSNYARPRPNVEKLEKMLRAAKERLQDAKKQARLAGVMLIDGTPQTNSLHGSPRVESPSTLKSRRREDRSPDAPRPSNNAHDSSPSPIRRSIHNSPAADRNGARSDPSSRQRKRTPPRGYRDDSISPVPEKRSKGDRHDRHEKKRHRDYRHRRSVSYSPARERRRSRSPRESRRRKKDKISNGSRSRDKYSDKYRR